MIYNNSNNYLAYIVSGLLAINALPMHTLTPEDVVKLSDDELREELEARGTPVGPISDFLRYEPNYYLQPNLRILT